MLILIKLRLTNPPELCPILTRLNPLGVRLHSGSDYSVSTLFGSHQQGHLVGDSITLRSDLILVSVQDEDGLALNPEV